MPITLNCKICGLSFNTSPCEVKRNGHIRSCCSRACGAIARRGRRIPEAAEQRCTDCGTVKPITEFKRTGRGSRYRRCLPCLNAHRVKGYPAKYRVRRSFVDSETGARVKQCTKCDSVLSVEQFRIHRYGPHKSKTTWRSMCFACDSAYGCTPKEKARKARWIVDHPELVAEANIRRHTRMRNAVSEVLDLALIIRRDRSQCYLCAKKLTRKEITFDHVIPITRGGWHTYDNLRVACRPCNSRKNTYLLSELKARGRLGPDGLFVRSLRAVA